VPPLAPQAVPPLVPPLAPQAVPPLVPPLASQAVPPLVPPKISLEAKMVVAPKKVISSNPESAKPVVEITPNANSATLNHNMITNIPGRQPLGSYAMFRNEKTGAYRECVVSGLERRNIVLPSGEIIYKGNLPSLRTVSSELADIPSWHPHEAGCIISIQHKK
jgi:hypothetical protein